MTTARRKLELIDLLQMERPDWTLVDLLAVLRRRRSYLVVCTAGMLLLATAYCLLVTPRFQATGEIEVEKEPAAAFGLESRVNGDTSVTAPDSLDSSMNIETEARILQSPALALQVIKDLKLETSHDYFPSRPSGIHVPGWIFFWRKPVEPLFVGIDDAPNRRYAALKIFDSRLTVKPETGTRLIEVSYSDPDPERAAAVVNRLLEALTDYTYQTRFRTTVQASAWLASQLTDLRRQTMLLENKAGRLQYEAGVYGGDTQHNVILDRLDQLNQRVAVAESNRLLMEAVDRISQSGDAELISSLAGSTLAMGAPGVGNSMALIQTLRSREAEVHAQIAESDSRYGPAHPRIAELHSELDGVENSIHQEVIRLGQRSHADFEIAQAAETSAREAFDKQRALADQVSGKSVAYQFAKQEADGSRGIYQELLGKLKEAGVLEGLRSTNITIVDPGRVPPTHHPRSPNLPICYAAAFIGGLFFGAFGGIAAEISDHTVRSLDGLERLTGSQLLGTLPHLQPEKGLHRLLLDTSTSTTAPEPLFLASDGPHASLPDTTFLEALRSLRTSLLLLRSGRRSQVILVTSSIAGEGKSKIAVNLAGVLAQLGARVLLVDADLRRPTVHNELHLQECHGLGAALLGNGSPEIFVCERLGSLSVLCGRQPVAMPAELLASTRMADLLRTWRREYDFVLLDSPPLLPATDALVLSQMSDIALLIARHGFTPKQAIHRVVTMLQNQIPETCLLRVVLNDVHSGSYEFREYYGYEPSAFTASATH